jgi:hypothetical protein
MLLASSDVSCAPGSSSRGEDRCAWCGDLMPDGLRAEAKFCSKRCRQAASRSRLKSKPVAGDLRVVRGADARRAQARGALLRKAVSAGELSIRSRAQTPRARARGGADPGPARQVAALGDARRERHVRRRPRREVSDITGLPRSAPYHHAARLGAQDRTCGGRLPTSSDDRSTAAKRSSR